MTWNRHVTGYRQGIKVLLGFSSVYHVPHSHDFPRSLLRSAGNHPEERLLDQAQAQTCTPPILGDGSRSLPQGMILDV